MKLIRIWATMGLILSMSALNSCGGSTSPSSTSTQDLIDIHAHATVSSGSASAQGLVEMLTDNNVSKMILMEAPRADYRADDNSSEAIINFFTSYSSSFRYMYGGSELQPLLFARGYNGTLPITSDLVYPEGGTFTEQNIYNFNEINGEADGGSWETIFRNRATTAAQSGKYVGFGELAPRHVSTKSGQPEMTYVVDTPWMLWLSDLAADYNMVLDLHIEATSTTLPQLATLLSHNTNTKIIWDHAGWSNIDSLSLATASVISQLLADHSNLYLSLKMRADQEGKDFSPVDSSGNIKSEWSTLLTTYADRIMVGTDAKYWTSSSTVETDFEASYSLLNAMLEQLPSETAIKIRNGTATALFGL